MNNLIREYFEQVLQNHKNRCQTMPFTPLSPLYWKYRRSSNMDSASLDISQLQRIPGTKWSAM